MGNNGGMGADERQDMEKVEIAALLPATVPENKKDVAGGVEIRRLKVDREERIRKRIGMLTYERFNEFLLTALFSGTELYFDMEKYLLKMPSNSNYSYLFPKMGEADLSPTVVERFNSMGDIFEITVGSGIIRFSLAIVEEIFKSAPAKLLVRNVMQDNRMQRLGEKLIGTEKISELARTGEITMSDDAQFWISLVPWTIIKAAHSLGIISLGAHDHIGAAVPHMLIGQAFAVASLVATHYGTKNFDAILGLTKKVFTDLNDSAVSMKQKFDGLGDKVGQNLNDATNGVDEALFHLDKKMNDWMMRIDEFDPRKVIPSSDQVWKNILGERIWNALGLLGVENEKEEQDEF